VQINVISRTKQRAWYNQSQDMNAPVILNNRYQLQERLGTGGMAMVYRAHDLTLERTVAIKILRKDFSNDPSFRQRFHQEAKAAANLSHPNIVTVHDFGLYSDQLFIVMEFVPGNDLKKLLKERNNFKPTEAIELITQACAGIGYAHRAGLVHCDIKPQNMLITPDNRLKVVDFGIARLMATISPDEQSDVVWGSPQYFSPEQAAGMAPSPASDVYSLGVVLYEILTGRLPFVASTADELARLHRESLPPSPRRFNPSISIPLEQVLLKILAKEPASRYRTADQLGRVLTSLAQQPPAVVQPAPSIEPELGYSSPTQVGVGSPSTSEYLPEHIEYVEEEAEPNYVLISPPKRSAAFDYVTWLLALLALIAVGGLIPFWLWVIYVLNPPV
jgi:serine/threonine protein kinase